MANAAEEVLSSEAPPSKKVRLWEGNTKAPCRQSQGRQGKVWNESFQRLVSFKEEHGHALVPHSYERDKALGLWVSRQRHLRVIKKLPADREERLLNIGFVWNVQKNFDDQHWQCMFQAAIAHEAEPRLLGKNKKSCSACTEIKDTRLHNWMKTQRAAYEAQTLNPDREEQLKRIGFCFEGPLVVDYVCIKCKCKLQDQNRGQSGAYSKLKPIIATLHGMDEDLMDSCTKSLEKMLHNEKPEWSPGPIGICSARSYDRLLNLVLDMDKVLDTSDRSMFFLHKCELLLEQYMQFQKKLHFEIQHKCQERKWCPRSNVESILPASSFCKMWMQRLASQPYLLAEVGDDDNYSMDGSGKDQSAESSHGSDNDDDEDDDDDDDDEYLCGYLAGQLEAPSEENSWDGSSGEDEEWVEDNEDCNDSVRSDTI